MISLGTRVSILYTGKDKVSSLCHLFITYVDSDLLITLFPLLLYKVKLRDEDINDKRIYSIT